MMIFYDFAVLTAFDRSKGLADGINFGQPQHMSDRIVVEIILPLDQIRQTILFLSSEKRGQAKYRAGCVRLCSFKLFLIKWRRGTTRSGACGSILINVVTWLILLQFE